MKKARSLAHLYKYKCCVRNGLCLLAFWLPFSNVRLAYLLDIFTQTFESPTAAINEMAAAGKRHYNKYNERYAADFEVIVILHLSTPEIN